MLAAALAVLCAAVPARAIDVTAAFRHTPERVSLSADGAARYRMEIPSSGIKRARILAVSASTCRAVAMASRGAALSAEVPAEPGAFALLYQFQIETEAGQVIMSAPYTINLDLVGGPDTAKLAEVRSRISQLQTAIRAIEGTDPQQLGRSSRGDIDRVSELLRRKEENLIEARRALADEGGEVVTEEGRR